MSHEGINADGEARPWRVRIVAYRLMPVAEILENPKAWRIHPEAQTRGLRAVLDQVGLVKPLILNERTGRLVDGKARLDLARRNGQEMLPVIIVDLSEEEEALILATLDPLAALAEADGGALEALLAEISIDDGDIQALLVGIAEDAGLTMEELANLEVDGDGSGTSQRAGGDEPTAPGAFPEFGEDIPTEHQCPKCGYRWSGKSGPSKGCEE